MTDDKEWEVEWSDEVKEAAAKDPKMAEFLREMGATVRQAMAGVKSGQYATFEDGMFALTGQRTTPTNPEGDDDVEGSIN